MKKNKKPTIAPSSTNTKDKTVVVDTIKETDVLAQAAAATSTSHSSMDRNHQVDMMKMIHETFCIQDPEIVKEHTGVDITTISKINHIAAIGKVVIFANEVAFGTSDFALMMRKSELATLKEIAQEVGISINDTKFLPVKDEQGNTTDIVRTESAKDAVEVSEDTKKQLAVDNISQAKGAAKIYDPTKIEGEQELIEALKYFMSTPTHLIENLNKTINFYLSYMKISHKDDEKEIERLNNMSCTAVFQEIIALTGAPSVVTNGLGMHLFVVTAQTDSPVSAFCILKNATTKRSENKNRYTDHQIADFVKMLVTIVAQRIITSAEAKIVEEEAKGEKKSDKQIETFKKNIAHAQSAIEHVTNCSSDTIDNLITNYYKTDNTGMFAQKIIKSIVSLYYADVDKAKFGKVKIDSLLKNCQIYASIITNLFRDPLNPIKTYEAADITELQFKSDEEIEAEKKAAKEAADKAAEEKKAEDAKKAEEGKKKAHKEALKKAKAAVNADKKEDVKK